MSVTIGEINPDGRNNAIYTFLRNRATNEIQQIVGGEIFYYYSIEQTKNKYGFVIDFEPPDNVLKIPTAVQSYNFTLPRPTNNLYWQCQISNKDICTVGETLSGAQTTSALVLQQDLDPAKPAQ